MKKSKINLVGISSVGMGGKDTLYLILEKILKEHSIITDRVALADPLKIELSDFVKNNYGLSIFTKDLKEKQLLRPLMVVHGKIKRTQTNGKYFTSIAQKRLDENIKENNLTIITDIRYSFYSEDEIGWLKSNGGILVHITRILPDGREVGPANKDEAENDPKIKEVSDFHLKWPTTDDSNIREDLVRIQLKELINKLINND